MDLRPFYGLCKGIKQNTRQIAGHLKYIRYMWIVLPGKLFVILFSHPCDSHNTFTLHSMSHVASSFSLLCCLLTHLNINQHQYMLIHSPLGRQWTDKAASKWLHSLAVVIKWNRHGNEIVAADCSIFSMSPNPRPTWVYMTKSYRSGSLTPT